MKLLKYTDIENKINEQEDDLEDEKNYTSEEFLQACQIGNIALLKDYIFQADWDVNDADDNDYTALMHGIEHLPIVEFLIQNGADVNLIDEDGYDALMVAVAKDVNINIINAIIKAGSDLDRQDNISLWTSLMRACEKDRVELIEILIKNGADLTLKNDDEETANDIYFINYKKTLDPILLKNKLEPTMTKSTKNAGIF